MFLLQLAARHEEITAMGGAAMGIGPAAAYQARQLIEERSIPYPLLLDPGHGLTEAIGLRRQPLLRFVFHLRAWWRWLRTVGRGRQGKITGAYWEVPAVIVVDASARVVWAHRGRYIGDYPSIDEALDRLGEAIG